MYVCLCEIIWFGCHHCIIMCSTTTLLPYLLRCSRCMHWLSIYTVWSLKPSLLTCTYWQLLPTIVHYSMLVHVWKSCSSLLFKSLFFPQSHFPPLFLLSLSPFLSSSQQQPTQPMHQPLSQQIPLTMERHIQQTNERLQVQVYIHMLCKLQHVHVCAHVVYIIHGKHTCIEIMLFMFSSCLSLSHSLTPLPHPPCSCLHPPPPRSVHCTTGNMPAVEDPTGVYVSSQGAAGMVWRCTCLSVPVWGGPDDVSTGC